MNRRKKELKGPSVKTTLWIFGMAMPSSSFVCRWPDTCLQAEAHDSMSIFGTQGTTGRHIWLSDPLSLNATMITYDLTYGLDGYHPASLVLNYQDYYWSSYA